MPSPKALRFFLGCVVLLVMVYYATTELYSAGNDTVCPNNALSLRLGDPVIYNGEEFVLTDVKTWSFGQLDLEFKRR